MNRGQASGSQVPHAPHRPPQSRSLPGSGAAAAAVTAAMWTCTG